ncbi:MAG: fibrinogen-binding protein, partial [Planctomycetota bacterium]|nr:fibrinogen-binding protein [Planctomycetota bacterium]
PAGYQDHVDTEGTNQGIPINPTDSIEPFVLYTLASGVDPANDAILRIALNWGDHAERNNFSEIATGSDPFVPPNPPSTPLTPVPQTPPTFFAGGLLRGGGGFAPDVSIGGLSAPPSGGVGCSWHLSIINAGAPRGERGVTTQWQNISYLSEANWESVDMTRGVWMISQQQPGEIQSVPETREFTYGMDQGLPLAGDFNGDGVDELLMYANGFWYVDMNSNMKWDGEDLWAELGSENDLPVVGDWDGDGKDDIGIYGPQWANDLRAIELDPGLPDLANELTGEAKNIPPRKENAADGTRTLKYRSNGQARNELIDHVFRYGGQTEQPITGDWNGDGVRNIGTFKDGTWKLDSDGDGRLTTHDRVLHFGQQGDLPVVGDFDGDGIEQLGIFRAGTWIIDSNSNGVLDQTDKVFELGVEGDLPVAGDFDGDGIDEPSVYRAKGTQLTGDETDLREAG